MAKENCWIYVAPKNENVIVNCKANSKQTTLSGVGILNVEPGCKAYTKSLILSSKTSFKSNLSISFGTSLELQKEIEDVETIENVKPLFLNLGSKSFNLNNQIEEINKLSYKIKDLKNINSNFKLMTTDHRKHFYSLYSCIIIIIVILGYKFCKKLYKFYQSKKEKRQTPECHYAQVSYTVTPPSTSNLNSDSVSPTPKPSVQNLSCPLKCIP